tara:strand:- start:582 stop:911 length:330 start_codon:yes stop_codon:yes gene_type:complete
LINGFNRIDFPPYGFVNLQLKIKQGLESECVTEVNKILPDTRSFDGCHALYFVQNQEDLSNLEFFSKWDSKEHYDKYVQWRVDSGVMEELDKYFDGEPVWRFFDLKSEF